MKNKRDPNIIWLVWADRGSYSDRNEYAVCWFDSEAEAKTHAQKLQSLSESWLKKFADTDWMKVGYDKRGTMQKKAIKEIGDEQWSPSDDTTYNAFQLQRGG